MPTERHDDDHHHGLIHDLQALFGVVAGYATSVANLAAVSLASDKVFGNDGAAYQLATVTGNTTNGFAATLTVGLAV